MYLGLTPGVLEALNQVSRTHDYLVCPKIQTRHILLHRFYFLFDKLVVELID